MPLAKCNLPSFVYAQVRVFYCIGLFQTSQLLSNNRSLCINLSYGRPAGTFSVCASVDVDVIFASKFRVPYSI